MIEHRVEILKKKWLSPDIFSIELNLPGINPDPGQFLQVQINESYDPLLNRPISIADYEMGRSLLVIKIVGRGTKFLSRKDPGDELVVFGPFGKGVKIKKKRSLIIAGGMGIAPLYFLARRLNQHKIDFTFIYGAKTPEGLILKSKIKKISPEIIFVAETGGEKTGTALSALNEIEISKYEVGYVCGPKTMLNELKRMNLKIPIYAFCEDFLGCGCGLCLGCAIKYYGSYKRICEDGPVFRLEGIEFE